MILEKSEAKIKMIDHHMRRLIDPPFNFLGHFCASKGIRANQVTLVGFFFGLVAVASIMNGFVFEGLIFIFLNRFMDGLDGGIARVRGVSDFGGYLDIICDFVIYALIPFAFGYLHPHTTLAISFLIASYIAAAGSFLAYAIMAQKHNHQTTLQGKKSFYYLSGISEGTETFLVMVLMCLFQDHIIYIAYGYGVLCWLTGLGRSLQAWKDFS